MRGFMPYNYEYFNLILQFKQIFPEETTILEVLSYIKCLENAIRSIFHDPL